MSDIQYQHFLICRQTKIFSRGIQPVLNRFELTRKESLRDRKIVEMFGYILRVIVQQIVFQAVKLTNKNDI